MGEVTVGKVVLLGFGTVFVGLILLILLTKLESIIVSRIEGKDTKEEKVKKTDVPAGEIADRGAFTAAVATAVSQCMGVEVSGIRILSIKKVN